MNAGQRRPTADEKLAKHNPELTPIQRAQLLRQNWLTVRTPDGQERRYTLDRRHVEYQNQEHPCYCSRCCHDDGYDPTYPSVAVSDQHIKRILEILGIRGHTLTSKLVIELEVRQPVRVYIKGYVTGPLMDALADHLIHVKQVQDVSVSDLGEVTVVEQPKEEEPAKWEEPLRRQ